MKYLIIFNFLISISIIIYFIRNNFPFYIEVNKTFWFKKPHSITLWYIISWRYYNGKKQMRSAKGLFTIPFRNIEKIENWDSDEFNKKKNINAL